MNIIKDLDNIIWGGDPEFRLKKNDTWINANELLSGGNNAIGCDGCSSTGELRIGMGTIPELLTRTYYFLGALAYKGWDFYGGGYQDEHPLGGHIHISYEGLSNNNADNPLVDRIAENLHWIYDLLTPEKSLHVMSRRNAGYGSPYSIREQGTDHIEFREPLAWTHAPELMILYYVIAYISIVNKNFHLSDGILERGVIADLKNIKNLDIPESIVQYVQNWDMILEKARNVDFNISGNYYWNFPTTLSMKVFK